MSRLFTLIGSILCIVAMVAAIMREGPFWVQLAGATGIAVLLVAGSLINSTAREAIERMDTFLKEVEEERENPPVVEVVRLVRKDEDEDGDDDGYQH